MEPQPLNFQIRRNSSVNWGSDFSVTTTDVRSLRRREQSFRATWTRCWSQRSRPWRAAGRVARGEARCTLRVAIPSAMANALIAPAIKAFHATYPDVSFNVRQADLR